MDRSGIAIVIPAFNEESTIGRVVASVSSLGVSIVVDDGSADRTGVVAAAAGAVVARHSHNRGYDQALNSGFARAREMACRYVLTMDADGQHDAAVARGFLQALEDGADIVAGVRDRRQRMAEHVFAWLAQIRWGLLDPLCGMKAYRMEVYEALGHFDCYASIGTELLLFAARSKRRIVQLPVPTRARPDHARFGKRWPANQRILRALWRGWFFPHACS